MLSKKEKKNKYYELYISTNIKTNISTLAQLPWEPKLKAP